MSKKSTRKSAEPISPEVLPMNGSNGSSSQNPTAAGTGDGIVFFTLSMETFGKITTALPSAGIFFCFITACIFQHSQVTETECGVENNVPSISGITGVSPQRYVWRFCIGLQSMPRCTIAFIYYNYYMSKLHNIAENHQNLYKLLLKVNFWLYMVENLCLILIAYISNKENYPVHEKIFVFFMISALCYECSTLILYSWSNSNPRPEHIKSSLTWKKRCFVLNLILTACLLFFFVQHRVYCLPGAFSVFATMEYGIAYALIGFHYTALLDFKGMKWHFGSSQQPINNNHHKIN